MNEKDLARLVVDRMLLPKGWTRDPVGAGVKGTVMLHDDAGLIYHWPDPGAFLFGRGDYLSVFRCLGMRQCDSAGSCEELEMTLRIGGLL